MAQQNDGQERYVLITTTPNTSVIRYGLTDSEVKARWDELEETAKSCGLTVKRYWWSLVLLDAPRGGNPLLQSTKVEQA